MTLPVLVAVADAAPRPAELIDLGLGGACVAVDVGAPATVTLSPGSRVALLLDAPQRWDPLKLEATVTWSRARAAEVRAGLKFEHVSGDVLLTLTELLETSFFG